MEVDTSVMIILVMSWNTSTTAQVWLSWFCHKFVMDVHAWQKTWPTVTNTYHHGSVFFCSVLNVVVRSASEWYSNPVLEVMLLDHDEPTNYEEAMMSPDSAKWLEAMKSEMGSMYENKVWTLIDLPNDRRAIEIKWIFKRKTDADSSVTIYKARIVAKRFSTSSRCWLRWEFLTRIYA